MISYLDHLVLTVRDICCSVDFYTRVLGMQEVSFGNGRKALSFGSQKINLHEVGKEFEPKAEKPTAGSADICFITEISLSKIVEHIQGQGVAVFEGPVSRTGARGAILSVYLRDPDGNLIEISQYL